MTTPYETTTTLNHIPGESMSPAGRQRKKLQLKPRTNPHDNRRSSSGAKNDPFGSAIPREQVLKQRGIDPATIDSRFERKATVPHYTGAQELEIESVQAELTELEDQLREANESELPEEEFRLATEKKRGELADLMKKYASTEPSRFDRPLRTRRHEHEDHRQHDYHHRHVGGDEDEGDAYTGFSSNRRRDHSHWQPEHAF